MKRITAEQVQSDVESYMMRASPDGRLRVIREALDTARCQAIESLALAAGLPADATPAEVVARVGALRGYVDDMAEHNCQYGYGESCNEACCVGCSARLASEAGR
jgi:hypothetical protein